MKTVKIDVYRDSRKEWRWEMYSRNGLILAASTEGYKRRRRALENLRLVTGVWIPAIVVRGVMREFYVSFQRRLV